ncbi:MAG: hypothetical protein HYX94_02605 [Chloroflexi bacterium]|nr:hypothetical protein [Chloroflexota bacterium]
MSRVSTLRCRKRLHPLLLLFVGLLMVANPLLVGCRGNDNTEARLAPGLMASPDYSMQVFVWGTPNSVTQRDLKLVKDAGFTWIKQMFPWTWIEGRDKGQFEWNEPDRIVKAAATLDLKILARLDISPMWARPKNADQSLHGPPVNHRDFGDFVSALAARYKGQIKAYQIWNEPNLAREWEGKQPNAVDYVDLLKVAYQAIKAQDPEAIVISAGLSPTTASGAIATPDVEYLQQMYAAGARQYFDVLGVHGAGFKSPPEADPAQVAKDPAATNHDASSESARRVYSFRHVEDLRQVMLENGDKNKQVAVLEFGWTSDPRPNSPYAWHAVSEEQKAKYLAGAYTYAREHWKPWIGIMSLIYIASAQWTEKDEQYWWSITDERGSPRTAYEELKKMKK